MIRKDQFSATNMVKDISQFMRTFSSDTMDPYTGVVLPAKKMGVQAEGEKKETKQEVQKQDGSDTNEGTSSNIGKKVENQIPTVLSFQGTASFKDGNLKGFLDEEETLGLLAIQGELKNEVVVLDCNGKDQGTVGVNIKDTNSKMLPHSIDQNVEMSVAIQVEADISEITCPNLNVDTKKIEELNKQLEAIGIILLFSHG
ncbi:Ger(x)C family spore germination C-terminal domain-containing protein [Virgibacillus ndiopensis]|uniref:Ger(x)C family spore germination C-terminal domain-containing protein n=1 Tax=Virgibacillus ndiopensis TaxID=2004408 RepID=UPI001145F4D1|nr:Ger(x)C family spore germination C-terminal domain-containing protein [Virgibacillus ndiopensis]